MHIRLDRRAILKAGVALSAVASGALVACTEADDKPADAATERPLVNTAYGPVRGMVEDGVMVFKGVRYAADTAKTRFAAPVAPEPWTDPVDTIAYGASAPQVGGGDGGGLFASWRQDPPLPTSEDCLFLNVWTPSVETGTRPVMVWFHGGGFATGSGSAYAYDGVRLANRGDVVVVTVNHRLNQFGYLNLAHYGERFAMSPAAGVVDMIFALEWVRDNIAAFGGDPSNVMIFGESGGGAKVCTLLSSERAKGLFHRAAVQSGPWIAHPPVAVVQKAADEVVAKLGLTADTIDAILTLPVEDIQAASKGVVGAGSSPTIDGSVLTRDPFSPNAAPAGADVPLLIGCNRTEGTSLDGAADPTLFDLTWETLPVRLQMTFPGRDIAKIIDAYKADYPDIEAPELYFMAGADARFFQGSVTVADRKADQGGAPIWFYMLDWETPVMGGKRYVPHALDIGMVFDNVAKSESMSGPTGPAPQAIADQMSESWLAFAKSGDPSNAVIGTWPTYTREQRNMMVFRTQPGVETDIRAKERALLTG